MTTRKYYFSSPFDILSIWSNHTYFKYSENIYYVTIFIIFDRNGNTRKEDIRFMLSLLLTQKSNYNIV